MDSPTSATPRARVSKGARLFVLLVAFLAASCPLLPHSARAGEAMTLRISLENACDHFQAQAVAAFARDLERRAGGRLKVELFCGAQLFRDWDVVHMLELGRAEMAVPGAWQLSRYEPAFDVFMLPFFMGNSPETHHRLVDGPLGAALAAGLERKKDVVVIGRWLDLGRAHFFGVARTLRAFADLAGLRVRIPGGEVNEMALRSLGAKPTTIPWPDLPRRLQTGGVDAILTTYETIVSARLWDQGVTSVFESAQYFSMYAPLVSRTFWKELPEDLRDLVRAVWEETVEPERQSAARRQAEAKAAFARLGGVIVRPDAADLDRARALLAQEEERFVRQAGIAEPLVRLARDTLPARPAEAQ